MNKSTLLAAAMTGMLLGAAGAAQAQNDEAQGRSGPSVKRMADPPKGEKGGGEKHACKGKNSCKGKGGCKTDKHACAGHNECKGQGGCATDGSKK